MSERDALRAFAERIARAAGEIQRARFETQLDVRTKSASIDLVTEVDHACEKLIVDAIHAARTAPAPNGAG